MHSITSSITNKSLITSVLTMKAKVTVYGLFIPFTSTSLITSDDKIFKVREA